MLCNGPTIATVGSDGDGGASVGSDATPEFEAAEYSATAWWAKT